MYRKILLIIFPVLLFVLVIEASSWFLNRAHVRLYWEKEYVPGEIWNLDHAKNVALQNGRNGDLARIILKKKFDPALSTWSPQYHELSLEPPVHLPSENNRSLFSKPGVIAHDLDDSFSVFGARTSRLKYKVQYTTDAKGRRIGFTPKKYNQAFLFMGCSFTFGSGVNNEESFPYMFGKKTGTRTYNLGVPGASPATFLYRMREENISFLEDIKDENVTVVLTIIPEHVTRLIGTTELFRNPESFHNNPYFYHSGNELKATSSFAKGPGMKKHFHYALSKSNFLSVLNFELPAFQEDENYLFAKVISEIQHRMKKNKNVTRFAVALFPSGRGQKKYDGVVEMMKKLNIEILDYSMIKGSFMLGDSYSLMYDGHPSPLTYDLYASLLSYDLLKSYAQ